MKRKIVLRTPARNYTFQELAEAYEAAVIRSPEVLQTFSAERQPSASLCRSISCMNRWYLRQQKLYAVGRTIAAVFIAGLLFFGAVLTVNAEARQAVLSWWKNVWEDRVLYLWDSFTGSTETAYTLTYIPEGYELIESGQDETSGYWIYEGKEGNFVFEYSHAAELDELWYSPLGEYTHWQIEVNGSPADVYQDDYEENTYTVVQIDAQRGCIWYLDAQMEWDTLRKIIEGVDIVEQKRL